MAAPLGNNYWEFRGKNGRDFAFTPETLWDEAVSYFSWISEKTWYKNEAIKSGEFAGQIIKIPVTTPMSLESFCIFADIDRKTFDNYNSNEGNYKDFFPITTRIKSIIESQQFEGATIGAFNPNIIARKLGLADRTDHTTNGKDLPAATAPVDLSKLSTSALLELAKAQEPNEDTNL